MDSNSTEGVANSSEKASHGLNPHASSSSSLDKTLKKGQRMLYEVNV